MKRTLVASIAAALIAVLAISLVSASEIRLQLTPVGGSTASGTAKIERDVENSGIQDVEIQVKVTGATPTADTVFEGWLVDKETGFKLSMGGFQMDQRGRGKLQFEQKMVNFDIFDTLIITTEPVNDPNPNPGTSILEADISGLANNGTLDILSSNNRRRGSNSGRGSSNSGSGREDRIIPTNGVVTSIIADNRGRGLDNRGRGREDVLTVLDQRGGQDDLVIETRRLSDRQSNMGRASTFIRSASSLSGRNGLEDTLPHAEIELEHGAEVEVENEHPGVHA